MECQKAKDKSMETSCNMFNTQFPMMAPFQHDVCIPDVPERSIIHHKRSLSWLMGVSAFHLLPRPLPSHIHRSFSLNVLHMFTLCTKIILGFYLFCFRPTHVSWECMTRSMGDRCCQPCGNAHTLTTLIWINSTSETILIHERTRPRWNKLNDTEDTWKQHNISGWLCTHFNSTNRLWPTTCLLVLCWA